MKIINKARGTGKTLDLLKHAAENNFTIVCLNQNMKQYIKRMAEELGFRIPDPITVEELRYNADRLNGKNTKIAVDDADVILEGFLKTRIYEITVSEDL